ncbi:hypothetical protein ABPG77_010692 [Micractinium sp. CCAP 211/92]
MKGKVATTVLGSGIGSTRGDSLQQLEAHWRNSDKRSAWNVIRNENRWRRVWNTSTLLHATLSLDLAALEAHAQHGPSGLPSLLGLLAQRGQAARRLWLHSEGEQLRMADVLRLVAPPLQSVFLGAGAPPASCQLLLCRFPGLRSLDLPAAACSASTGLAGFEQLEELTLREGAPPALLSSLAGLPLLRLLSLTIAGEAVPHRELGALHRLEELHVYLAPSTPARFDFQPSALAALRRLRCVLLIATSSLCESLTLGPGLAGLPSLQELQVDGQVDRLPCDLWACQHLTRLDLDLKCSATLPPAPEAHASAPALLPALQELRLVGCRLPGGALPPAVCQLAGLRRLEVQRCGLTSGCLHHGLPHQISQLEQLTHLSLAGNSLSSLAPLAALPALRHLDCSANPLTWLPPGPYLGLLEALLLSATSITVVPPVLCAASRLEVLDLSGLPGLELSLRDVQCTLARMPRLSLLLLGKQAACQGAAPGGPPGLEWRTPSVAALVALGQALPRLQVDFEHTAAEFEGL